MKLQTDEKGFSLIELIIYVAIISIVSAIFIAILVQLNLGWTRSKMESEVQQNLRLAIENISQTMRVATSISAPAVEVSGTTTTAVVGGQTVRYATTSAGILQKTTGSNPPENITTDSVRVTYLNFTTIQNTATTTGSVITATATSTQFGITVEYNNSGNAQFQYVQSATSTARVGN